MMSKQTDFYTWCNRFQVEHSRYPEPYQVWSWFQRHLRGEIDIGKQYDSMFGIKPICGNCGGSGEVPCYDDYGRVVHIKPCPDCAPHIKLREHYLKKAAETFTLQIVGLTENECRGVTEHLGRSTPEMQDDMETYFSALEKPCPDGQCEHRNKTASTDGVIKCDDCGKYVEGGKLGERSHCFGCGVENKPENILAAEPRLCEHRFVDERVSDERRLGEERREEVGRHWKDTLLVFIGHRRIKRDIKDGGNRLLPLYVFESRESGARRESQRRK